MKKCIPAVCTGSSHPTTQGSSVSPKVQDQGCAGDDAKVEAESLLPRAHTCFFSINLPKYNNEEVMAAKLRYAIFNCTEMDADFRLTDASVAGWVLEGGERPAPSLIEEG